jgi:hypothetical protein
MAMSRGCRLMLVVVCIAQLAPIRVQATRPGPMLHGGTIIMLRRPRHGVMMHPSQLGPGSVFDAATLDRIFDGSSIFGPSTRMFEQQSPLASMFGEPRRPCSLGERRPQDQEAMMRHMAAARFGPSLLSSLLAAAEADRDGVAEAVYAADPKHKAAAQQPRRLGGVSGAREPGHHSSSVAWERFSIPAVAVRTFGGPGGAETIEGLQQRHGVSVTIDAGQSTMAISGEPRAVDAAEADIMPLIRGLAAPGSAEVAHRMLPATAASDSQPAATAAGATWRFRDFVSRVGGGAAAGDSMQRAQFEGAAAREQPVRLPHMWFSSYADGGPRTARPHLAQLPALSWDVFETDGQLNGGVLVFLLLCICCAAVWSRLLVLWCTFRAGGAVGRRRRLCRRFGPAAAVAFDGVAIKDGLEAPLLNPLHHEAPITGEPYRVEVATTYAAPADSFVTLQYVPLKGEL